MLTLRWKLLSLAWLLKVGCLSEFTVSPESKVGPGPSPGPSPCPSPSLPFANSSCVRVSVVSSSDKMVIPASLANSVTERSSECSMYSPLADDVDPPTGSDR